MFNNDTNVCILNLGLFTTESASKEKLLWATELHLSRIWKDLSMQNSSIRTTCCGVMGGHPSIHCLYLLILEGCGGARADLRTFLGWELWYPGALLLLWGCQATKGDSKEAQYLSTTKEMRYNLFSWSEVLVDGFYSLWTDPGYLFHRVSSLCATVTGCQKWLPMAASYSRYKHGSGIDSTM